MLSYVRPGEQGGGWDEAARITFASFLRRRSTEWRLRRRDFFVPIDFHLVQRQITLHGQINAGLLDEFRTEQQLPELDTEEERTWIYLPFATFPKQILLDFSTFDPSGVRIPLLTRAQAAHVTAEHLFGLFPRYARPRSLEERSAAMIALETIAASSPIALAAHQRYWLHNIVARRAGWRKRRSIRARSALSDQALFELWFETEANAFNDRLQDQTNDIRAALWDYILTTSLIPSADFASRQEFPFASLTEVLALSVQEALRIVADLHPSEYREGLNPRNRVLARRLQYLPDGIRALDRMLEQMTAEPQRQREELESRYELSARRRGETHPRTRDLRHRVEAARVDEAAASALLLAIQREIMTSSVSWMAYLVVPIRVGFPFHYRACEQLPLKIPGWWTRQLRRLHTRQIYHVDVLDSQATHIEVHIDDPALKLALRAPRVAFATEPQKAIARRRAPRTSNTWRRPEDVFAREFRESDRLAHFYTASRASQAPYRGRSGRILLSVQYNVVATIKTSYLIALAAVAGAISYAAYEWTNGRSAPGGRVNVVTIAVPLFAVIIAFMTARERRPLAHGKLEAFRLAFYAGVAALVAVILAWSFAQPARSADRPRGGGHGRAQIHFGRAAPRVARAARAPSQPTAPSARGTSCRGRRTHVPYRHRLLGGACAAGRQP
jgi:hypothetical protein